MNFPTCVASQVRQSLGSHFGSAKIWEEHLGENSRRVPDEKGGVISGRERYFLSFLAEPLNMEASAGQSAILSIVMCKGS